MLQAWRPTDSAKEEKGDKPLGSEEEARGFTQQCFGRADSLRAEWVERVTSMPIQPAAGWGHSLVYALKWRGFNKAAGMDRLVGGIPLFSCSLKAAWKGFMVGTFFVGLAFLTISSVKNNNNA